MLKMRCTNYTISPNRYPTRATYNGSYNPNTYFINVGDVMQITDMKVHSGNVVCQIGTIFNTDGSTTNILNGRWFVFDKDYFA